MVSGVSRRVREVVSKPPTTPGGTCESTLPYICNRALRSRHHLPVRVVSLKTRVETEGQNIRSSVSLQQTEKDYGRCSHLNQKEGGNRQKERGLGGGLLYGKSTKEICFHKASSYIFILSNFTPQPSVELQMCEDL